MECAVTNKDKLEHLSTPSPVRCFRCNTFLRALPVYPVTVFICDNQGQCKNEGKELVTNINNRYNCYYCDFDLCSECISKMLKKSGQEKADHITEDEIPVKRKITRRNYPKAEIGIQTSQENFNDEIMETNFSAQKKNNN